MQPKRLLLSMPLLLILTLSLLVAGRPALAQEETGPDRKKVTKIDFLGEVTFNTGFMVDNTEVGGLSGLTYDPDNDLYYAISDDRGAINDARFYTLTIDVADGDLQPGDIQFTAVATLLDSNDQPFPASNLDPEGIALSDAGALFISSEGVADDLVDPFVNEFSLTGRQIGTLPVPDKFKPTADQSAGIRNNLAFESLTLTPDARFLYTAVENALVQDGPQASVEDESLARVLQYDLQTGQPGREILYITDPVAEAPLLPNTFHTNGLVELLAVDNNGTLLALERSFSFGRGYTIKLYQAFTQGALDVRTEADLFWEEQDIPFEIDPPLLKEELLDFADFVTPDNLEGLALGPQLADGRQTLLVVSDNNFNDFQVTQFIALALTFETIPAALPDLETPRAVAAETPPAGSLAGDSNDPAIWVHPTDPGQSLVLVTLKDGGLAVLDLTGRVLETILPAPFGDIRYNNVDLIYDFPLSAEPVDLAVVSDRQNDTLAILAIDPDTRRLTDVTAVNIPETIFGEDDGEQTAYGLATFTSPFSGKRYAFVTQGNGNKVAQLELLDNGAGRVTAEIVRTLTLPTPTGKPEDSQAEGLVVDRELGLLYLAMEEEAGIFKVPAEPEGGDQLTLIHRLADSDFLSPDIEGLTIYYGPAGGGYLLVSSQGDSTYALFERTGDNAYLGSFVVGDNEPLDQANESDGIDVINTPLGPNYPFGLLVVQDGANDPQFIVQDEAEVENSSTNFKFVPWENVANAFSEPLLIDPDSYEPRAGLQQSGLTIVKSTSPAGAAGFAFEGDLGEFTLDDGAEMTKADLSAGAYRVVEIKDSFPDPNWVLVTVHCENLDNPPADPFLLEVIETAAAFEVHIPLRSDQNLRCVFRNEISIGGGNNDVYLPLIVKN